MLNSSLLEFVLRGIPEGFLFIFAGYTFSKTKVDFKKFLLAGALLSLLGYAIRLLPIHFGIHSVLVLIVCIILLSIISNISIMKAVSATFIMLIIGFAAEILNIVVLALVKGMDTMELFNNQELLDGLFTSEKERILLSFPSIGFMAIIVISFYMVYKQKGKLQDASDRKDFE